MDGISKKIEKARGLIADFLIENGYQDEKGGILGKSGLLLSGFRPITHHETFL